MSLLNQPSIITFSDSAREYIQNFIVNTRVEAGLRVSIKKTGCSGFAYEVDIVKEPQEDDLCVIEQGIRMFIDPKWVKLVQGMKIDLEEDENRQKHLIFHNPNAKHLCGCGESFTVEES
jgi:iron-sulfur cluster assembly protein